MTPKTYDMGEVDCRVSSVSENFLLSIEMSSVCEMCNGFGEVRHGYGEKLLWCVERVMSM